MILILGGIQKNAKKVGNNPVSKNLDILIRSGYGTKKNMERIFNEAGIAKTTIRSWINGHRRPQQASLEKIANIFGVDKYVFYEDPGEVHRTTHALTLEQKEVISII